MTDVVKRPTMRRPDTKAGDDLLEKMENVDSKHTEEKIRSCPVIYHSTSALEIARVVREAFESTTDQPNFRVLSYKANQWMVDSFPETGFDRVTVREFAPGVRHPNRLRRMYHQATYAGLRIVVNAMLCGILYEMIVLRRKDTNQTEITHFEDENNSQSCKLHVFLAPCSDRWRWGNTPLLVLDDQGRKLDPAEGVHLTVWCYLNGGGWIEIDATTLMHPTVTLHKEAPPAEQRITAEQGLQQARFAMAQRKETEIYEKALDALCKGVETLRDEKKRRAKAARRKRKRKVKKRKRISSSAGTGGSPEIVVGKRTGIHQKKPGTGIEPIVRTIL